MTKKGFRYLLLLSGISMLVLMAIQVYLFQVAYELKEVEFDNRVKKVLDNTVASLERKETALRVRNYLTDKGAVINRISKLKDTSNAVKSAFERRAFRQDRAFRDSMINNSLLFDIVDVITERDTGRVASQQRIQRMNLDSILRSQFRQQQLDVSFKYFVRPLDTTPSLDSNRRLINKNNKISKYEARLFPSFSYSDNHLLVLEIENSKDVILHSLLFFSLISISVFSLILYTIGNSIRTVLKQKQLSQVQKDFVNNVTHELKTPIASISLAADALLNEKVLNDHRQIQFYAERIIRENHRIDEKIDKILLSSAAEEGNLKLNIVPTDLNDIITTALEQMQPVIEKSAAQIKLNLKANNTLVLVDEQHLLNVIINLVDNAIKYAKAIPEVEIFMQNASRFLILIVRDNGIGIHERDKKHIFKRFFRASTGDAQHTKGFGIGLSYVFNIIRAHDGSIEVQSTVNKGSSFIIKLPLLKHA